MADGLSSRLLTASLPGAGSIWSSVVPSTLAGGGAISSTTAVGLASVGSTVYMALTRASDNFVNYYTLGSSGTPASLRTWTLVGAGLTGTSIRRPTISAARSVEDPSTWELVTVTVTPDAGFTYWRVSLGVPMTASYEAWDSESDSGTTSAETEAQYDAVGMVWDDRSSVEFPDLRIYRNRPLECGAGCPGTCGTVLGDPICVDTSSNVYARMETNPFGRGTAPGVYADYDDWAGLAWGFCENLVDVNAYAPTAYRNVNCGPIPVYSEPTEGGMSIVSPPGPSDPTDYPYLYEVAAFECTP